MRGGRWVIVGVVTLTVFALLVGPIASVGASADLAVEEELNIDADDIVLTAALQDDGNATFETEYRVDLTTEDDAAAFDELAAEINASPAVYLDAYEERFAPTVDAASTATGREMALVDLAVETERRFADRQIGVVRFHFTWTNFATVDGSQLTAGDALEGLLLDDSMALVVTWPASYGLVDATPSPDAERTQAVSWSGPREFGAEEPTIDLDTAAAGETPDDSGGLPWLVLIAVASTAVALGAGGWYYRQQSTTEQASTAATPPDDDLLSNEEQVLRLVSDRGGRMKQQEVAEALEWTDAKTSKVVGSLRESGDLESFRLGRENVLRLPEEDEPL